MPALVAPAARSVRFPHPCGSASPTRRPRASVASRSSPTSCSKLTGQGHEVVIEPGAGEQRACPGRALHRGRRDRLGDRGRAERGQGRRRRAPRRSAARQGQRPDRLPRAADQRRRASRRSRSGATAFAMEAIPRISRAQSMDALSSPGDRLRLPRRAHRRRRSSPRFFPMLMTAAGTIQPAQVLVLGAGVAGLQAIATARRLGAVVTAVRRPRRRQGAGRVARREVLRGRGHRRRRGRGRLRARADRRRSSAPAARR